MAIYIRILPLSLLDLRRFDHIVINVNVHIYLEVFLFTRRQEKLSDPELEPGAWRMEPGPGAGTWKPGARSWSNLFMDYFFSTLFNQYAEAKKSLKAAFYL